MDRLLGRHGLGARILRPRALERRALACPALPTCGQAVAEAERYLSTLLAALSARGVIGPDEIDAEEAEDPSNAGQRHAATARALQPTAEAKQTAWQRAVFDDELPNSMQEAWIGGFAHSTQGELVKPYMARYFEDIKGVWERRTSEIAQSVVVGLFPTWSSTISPETVAAADTFLADDDVPSPLRRLVSEGRADITRALRARAVDTAQSHSS